MTYTPMLIRRNITCKDCAVDGWEETHNAWVCGLCKKTMPKPPYLVDVRQKIDETDQVARLKQALDMAKVALDVAYEDTGDQYYKNVKDKIKELVNESLAEEKKESE